MRKMKFRIEKSFDRDVDKIKDKTLLRKLRTIISTIENAVSIREIPHIKKIEGYESYYRIKIDDHRLGMELISNREVVFVRFLHRKDIYRYFPKRR
jgi:mRNA interferase RelE/StbE